MTDSLSQQKSILRREARLRRKAFVAHTAPQSWTIGAGMLDDIVSAGITVASYRPMGSEADPAAAEHHAASLGAHGCFPRVDADGIMRFYSIPPYGSWSATRRAIDEGSSELIPVDPSILFIPLLAFDRRGTRLGQGGGHYDRTLATLRYTNALKVGIAWSIQEFDDLPREPWDIPLDAILTECEWIEVTS